MSDQIIFKRKVTQNGGSLGNTIPPELIDFLSLKEGSEIAMCADTKNGKALKLWNNDIPRSSPKRVRKKVEE